MSIFKNANEAAYVGGRKHWTDIIKNTGDGELLIWRQPEEDFNTNSKLIVMPGEEAIFIKGGIVEEVFTEGTHKLSSENYPFISRLRNAFSGGVSTFNCVVYFVKTSQTKEILWGTSSPIQVRDKLLGISTKVRTRGSYKIEICNSSLFLTKLLGNNTNALSPQELLDQFFANEFQSKIKSTITKILNETDKELLGIEAHIEDIANEIQPSLSSIYSDYGCRLINFSISAMDVDDDELRRRYDEIGMDVIAKMRGAQADKVVMGILGDDWGRQQAANILTDLSNNPGAGGVAAAGAGVGMGIGAGSAFGSMAQQMFAPMTNSYAQQQNPIQSTPSGRFTQQSATPVQSQPIADDPMEVLGKLKKLLDAGLIEQAEYDAKKAEILSRM